MNLAPPVPRLERARRAAKPAPADSRAGGDRAPVKSRAGALRRERHQADYVILVVVVALTAIGILMVYSSSALKGYLSQEADTFATVGPQIQWAILGLVAMAAMMRVDYRYLRLASVPMYVVAIVLLILVFVPALNIEVGGSARWLKLPLLPAVHPAEFAKLALVVYLAHWFAKRGERIRGFWSGTVPFLVIVAPVIALVFKEPDLGTTGVITLTAFTMFFVAGANLVHLAVMGAVAVVGLVAVGLRGLSARPHPGLAEPVARPAGGRLSHRPGAARARRRRAARHGSRRQPGLRPERVQRLHLRRGRAGVRDRRRAGGHRSLPDPGLLAACGWHWRAPDTFGALLGDRDHRLAVPPGVHQHRCGGGPAADHRDHAAVHQRRRLIPHHQLRGGRDPALDIARDRGQGDVERRCDC